MNKWTEVSLIMHTNLEEITILWSLFRRMYKSTEEYFNWHLHKFDIFSFCGHFLVFGLHLHEWRSLLNEKLTWFLQIHTVSCLLCCNPNSSWELAQSRLFPHMSLKKLISFLFILWTNATISHIHQKGSKNPKLKVPGF